MQTTFIITQKQLDLSDIKDILFHQKKLTLSQECIKSIKDCRDYLDDRILRDDSPIYGINTGFGSLHKVEISKEKLAVLQENLVKSHACGMGEEVPSEVVRLMLLFKIVSLSKGHSGVAVDTVNRLVELYNHDILPIVYTKGSLGASGDLAPLAHLSLPLLGLGEVYYKGEKRSTADIYKELNWKEVQLQSKEGLALLNGTQFMSAYGIYVLIEGFKMSYMADLAGAISLDAFDGRIEPFSELIQFIRPHNGQIKTAHRIREFLQDSQLITRKKNHVQDPYSFRCIPQVHGATKDALQHIANVFLTEINSVTDNPNIFASENQIISGGNFHGQPLALALDYFKIAFSELGNISERRIFQLVSGFRGLPEFLVDNPGLNSGFMIPQYTAASIVSANKQLATPASVDSIVSSNGQEDHVSMGANSATQAYEILKNVKSIIAIELFTSFQALEFRGVKKSSKLMQSMHKAYRKNVDFIKNDEVMYELMRSSMQFIDEFYIENSLQFD